jgi:hypothetical protein
MSTDVPRQLCIEEAEDGSLKDGRGMSLASSGLLVTKSEYRAMKNSPDSRV